MKTPKIEAPVESEADKAARLAAEKQAEDDRIAETQGLLASGTIRRQRRFGVAGKGSQGLTFGRTQAGAGGSVGAPAFSMFLGPNGLGPSGNPYGFGTPDALTYSPGFYQ